jgi:hypothetical protein
VDGTPGGAPLLSHSRLQTKAEDFFATIEIPLCASSTGSHWDMSGPLLLRCMAVTCYTGREREGVRHHHHAAVGFTRQAGHGALNGGGVARRRTSELDRQRPRGRLGVTRVIAIFNPDTHSGQSSHLPPIAGSKLVNPVTLPPGRARLATNPLPIGLAGETL